MSVLKGRGVPDRSENDGTGLACRGEVLHVLHLLSRRYLHGKEEAVRLSLIALLAEGHLLLEDIPGVGKTTLALALSHALGLSFGRIQCTSDILPSDITGLSIFDRDESRFRFVHGPIFHNLVLTDEINRAMPKTQSALLEAMEERRVTVEGKTYRLPDPFLVVATQNPSEQVGTFPLPESQLDRFLISAGLGYPPAEIEKAIIRGGSIREEIEKIPPILGAEQIAAARRAVREQIHLSEKVIDYIHALVCATREHRFIASGISPRGAISLADASKAAAFLEGRDYVVPEDVKALAVPVGAHRLILRAEHEPLKKKEVLRSIVADLPVPRG